MVKGWIFGVCLLAFGTAAPAQTIYKCKGAKGAISYQTDPCGPEASTSSVKTYQPVYDDPRAAARLRRIEAERDALQTSNNGVVVNNYGYASGSDPRGAKRAQCASAKAYRQATLDNVRLRRTYDLLQRLDDQVNRACAGL